MSGRHTRVARDNRHPQTAIDVEAAIAVTAIAGLCARLRRQELFEHPNVLKELRKLQYQMEEQLAYTDHKPGRHRSTVGAAADLRPDEASESSTKPQPLSATTSAEFVRALWRYKAWSGDLSWRKIVSNSNYIVVHSTLYNAMKSDALPKFDVVRTVIIGCGGSEEDLKEFAAAWRKIGGTIELP